MTDPAGVPARADAAASARVRIPVQVRWGDLDPYNHVNNVALMRILEEARVRAFWAPAAADEPRLPTAVFQPGDDSQTFIASHRVEYLKPIDYQREPLDVQLWLQRIGGASFEIAYEVFSSAGLTTRASSTLVVVHGPTGRPRRLRDYERAAWEPYVGEPVAFSRA
ncbi:acyl-CoA thioesterase [Ruicaihuangia caeni]|uniref:acyl-CoA thioesterase n=1 Tax=Ruicaihuangia caeni TaxID=3042517 RepID=UPI00338F2EEA